MSLKHSKRPSSKKKKPEPEPDGRAEMFHKLGLEQFWSSPLDPAIMLDLCTWTLKNYDPQDPKDLPKAFLQRLWLFSPDARSTTCKSPTDDENPKDDSPEMLNGSGEESQQTINPLDLVTAVYMTANAFLQQEMTVRMVQCQFAVPLVLPGAHPGQPGRFLLWPLRNVLSQWKTPSLEQNQSVQVGDLANMQLPMVSFMKIGHCSVSKSKVLNHIMSQNRLHNETFVHRDMEGGHVARRLSNGLVEIGRYLPSGDIANDFFPVPMVIANLRGNASKHEKCLNFLCHASSVVIVFSGNLREKEKHLLASCKAMARKLIVVDISGTERNENSVVGFVGLNFEKEMGMHGKSVLQGEDLGEADLANKLCGTLNDLLPDKLKLVTLEEAAQKAVHLGFNLDEGPVCKKALDKVEKVLEGLDGGSNQFREKQLPLQGSSWSKLAEIEKEKSKQKKEGMKLDSEMRKEKKHILAKLRGYKMTRSMKVFIDALSTSDKVQRAYFLNWMKLRLKEKQTKNYNIKPDLFSYQQAERKTNVSENSNQITNGFDENLSFSDIFSTDSAFEAEIPEGQSVNTELNVPDKEDDDGQEMEQTISTPTDEDPESLTKDLESLMDGVVEQQLDEIPIGNENHDEELDENDANLEEPIEGSNLVLDEQLTLSSQGSQQSETDLTLAAPNLTSTKQYLYLNLSTEPQAPDCIQPFPESPVLDGVGEQQLNEMPNDKKNHEELDERPANLEEPLEDNHLIWDEQLTLSSQGSQQSETDLTLAAPDLTSTKQCLYPNVSTEPQEPDFIEPFPESPVNGVVEQQLNEMPNDNKNHDVELDKRPANLEEPLEDNHLIWDEHLTLSSQGSHQSETETETLAGPDLISTKQCLSPDVSTEPQAPVCIQPLEPEPTLLGLEHFFREMGLIFDITHSNLGIVSQKVLRLPSVAADLLLYGVPLELMDGNASNIPLHWLGCVFAELRRCLPHGQCRVRVITNIGVYHARNAEVLSALFGVKFIECRERSTRGLYMAILCLPDTFRKHLRCEFLLLINVEGLCSTSQDNNINTRLIDNEMATVAAGLTNVLLHNVSSQAASELEADLTVIANALLRMKESEHMPTNRILVQNENINSMLHASQLKRVCEILQIETGDRGKTPKDKDISKATIGITCVKGPWSSLSLSEPVESQYGTAVLKFKKSLLGSLKTWATRSEATGLPEFMVRLKDIWKTVKEDSFSTSLQNNDVAFALCLLCTEYAQCESNFLDHSESWVRVAEKKIIDTKEKAYDVNIQKELLRDLKDEARKDINAEINTLRSNVVDYMMKNTVLIERSESLKPILMSYVDDLQDQVTQKTIKRLETANETHCTSLQVDKFERLLEKEQESKLHDLLENSRSTQVLLKDEQLEEEFEGVWNKLESTFNLRAWSLTLEDITVRVKNVLRHNLISRGLQQYIQKVELIGQKEIPWFLVYDGYFGNNSKVKNRLDAEQVANKVVAEYNQFVSSKSSINAEFSDSYIDEILKMVEKALNERSMEITAIYEVDLKVYLCSSACLDFQKLNDSDAKDRELLAYITLNKSTYKANFVYQYRKRDQCYRVARAFTSMVLRPTVFAYVYKALGPRIVQQIRAKHQQYRSSRAFRQSLLEELIEEDCFDNILEYLRYYDSFRQKKIQETVVAHLSESVSLKKWKQQKLGEIMGKIAAAVCETAEDTHKMLTDTKPLLERVCIIIESTGDVDVTRTPLDGPFFSITTEWDRFVTSLMRLLAELRVELTEEFSKDMDVTQLLSFLPSQPQQSLLTRVQGCGSRCPLCRAPCEEEELGHEVHKSLCHRPTYVLPFVSCISCSESMDGCESDEDVESPVSCRGFLSLHPEWNSSLDDPHIKMPSIYWRYVMVRFNVEFAQEYEKMPANVPEEWKKITKEEALSSLRGA